MLDGVSLDQLRMFVAAADAGSFSAAARRLRRVPSVVSEAVSNLEQQIGVIVFDRSGRYPKLTKQGTAMLADARGIVAGVDAMKARARGMASGLEPELSAVIDVFFPIEAITTAAREFRITFPGTPLRLYVEALGGVIQTVLDGKAGLGVSGPLPLMASSVSFESLTELAFVMVAASDHPLAASEGLIPIAELAKHVQLVLTDRTDLSLGHEVGVMSPSTWRLADLYSKHAFLLNGLGWGGMPLHAVEDDVASGRLVILPIENLPPTGVRLQMSAVYPTATPPGPAGRWLIERLKQCPTGSSAAVLP